jgi:hypothetical protein
MGRDRHDAPPVDWGRRATLVGVGLVLLIIGYFIATAFLPRWWAHRVGDMSNGTFHWGVWWGLFFGFLFTLAPLFVLRQLVRDVSWASRGWLLAGAVLLAAPNLMTLGIVLGTGNGAHAGDRTLDDNAPGFRWATLFGVLGAVALFVLVQYWFAKHRRTRRELGKMRADDKVRRAMEG